MLRASTMVETLVMMIVAGIVFLVVTEGLGMFMRLQMRRMVAMERRGRLHEGIYRLETLVCDADRVRPAGAGIAVHRAGAVAVLGLSDSALIYRRAGFTDTLLVGVGAVRLVEYDDAPDTVEITIRSHDKSLAVRFGMRRNPMIEYDEEIRLIEENP